MLQHSMSQDRVKKYTYSQTPESIDITFEVPKTLSGKDVLFDLQENGTKLRAGWRVDENTECVVVMGTLFAEVDKFDTLWQFESLKTSKVITIHAEKANHGLQWPVLISSPLSALPEPLPESDINEYELEIDPISAFSLSSFHSAAGNHDLELLYLTYAARKNHIRSILKLAAYHEIGQETDERVPLKRDPKKAFYWHLKAANLDDVYYVSNEASNPSSPTTRNADAEPVATASFDVPIRRCEEQISIAEAAYVVGTAYASGDGAECSGDNALEWLHRGISILENYIGIPSGFTSPTVGPTPDTIDTSKIPILPISLFDPQTKPTSLYISMIFQLALIYLTPPPPKTTDPAKAYHYFAISSQLGHAASLYNLGVLLLNGWGVEQNVQTAVKLLRRGINLDSSGKLTLPEALKDLSEETLDMVETGEAVLDFSGRSAESKEPENQLPKTTSSTPLIKPGQPLSSLSMKASLTSPPSVKASDNQLPSPPAPTSNGETRSKKKRRKRRKAKSDDSYSSFFPFGFGIGIISFAVAGYLYDSGTLAFS
ncbi:hypothetical protein BKA69DRAFT_1075548 [Paraphysoderma sedebokerense]|nr:hypothetical protein BKA69DRAFT_1075548 [Paraphysoderma sedebokerense]